MNESYVLTGRKDRVVELLHAGDSVILDDAAKEIDRVKAECATRPNIVTTALLDLLTLKLAEVRVWLTYLKELRLQTADLEWCQEEEKRAVQCCQKARLEWVALIDSYNDVVKDYNDFLSDPSA